MALQFPLFLINTGSDLSIYIHRKEKKSPLPATSQVILGRLFNSMTKRINTAMDKRTKYRLRIAALLITDSTTRKELEKIHGCLSYVADVEPFGRPFLAHLTLAMTGKETLNQ